MYIFKWYNFSGKRQKLSKLHSKFLEAIHLHLFDIQAYDSPDEAVFPAVWVYLDTGLSLN